MKGYMGKLLRVNLTLLEYHIEFFKYKILQLYFGGACFRTCILYKELKAGIDSFYIKNKLIFLTSQLSINNVSGEGSIMICFKSPVTDRWGQACCWGNLGPNLRKVGFDFLIVEGKAEKPVYLEIFNEQISFKDATPLLNKNVEERDLVVINAMLKEAKNPSVMTIGIVGDNLVKFAIIMCNDRAASRRGGVLVFVMDCFEYGVIGLRDTDNLEFSFESTASMPEMIKKIAYREGIGDIFAERVKIASEKLGEKLKEVAIYAKGLESLAHDVRSSKALALNYTTTSRGMCHIQPMDGVSYDKEKASFSMGKYGASDPNLIERYDEKGRGKDVAIM